jgi:hypothetical protein
MSKQEEGTCIDCGDPTQGKRCRPCYKAQAHDGRPTNEQAQQRINAQLEATEDPVTRWSEQKIARHKQLRRIEAETAARFRTQPVRDEPSSESVFSSLGFFMRRAKPAGSGWSCPTGGVRSF